MLFQKIIIDVISTISEKFKPNELAFLAVTSKIELNLRDRIAFEIHKNIGEQFLVCREWSPKTGNGKRIDLAIVEVSTSKPVCFIEFKAQNTLGYEEIYSNYIKNDFIKMQNCKGNDSVECYVIFFTNLIKSTIAFENHMGNSVKYFSGVNKIINQNKMTIQHCHIIWDKHLRKLNIANSNSQHYTILAGVYYGKTVTIEAFIIGPISDILN